MVLIKGSYYEKVPLFAPNDRGATLFKGLRARPLGKPEPVLEHTVAAKDRLDSIAHHYYAGSRDWRLIAESNPDVLFPEDLLSKEKPLNENGQEQQGHVILIPRRREVR